MSNYACFSKWRASTGRYDVIVTRIEEPDYSHEIQEATELRAFINENYDLRPSELAIKILDNYLGAVKVEVRDWNRNGVVIERESYGTSNI